MKTLRIALLLGCEPSNAFRIWDDVLGALIGALNLGKRSAACDVLNVAVGEARGMLRPSVGPGWSHSRISVDRHPLFAGVDTTALFQAFRIRRAARRALVCGPQLPPSVVGVLCGSLHAYTLTPDGRSRLVLEVLVPGDVDGMLIAGGFAPHMCETITEAEYFVISRSQLDRLVATSPTFASNLYTVALRRLERREAHMAALSERSGVRAVARQLFVLGEYAAQNDMSVAILCPRPTHQMLADMLGLRRETVTLSIKTLRSLHAIELGPTHMSIDLLKLSRLLSSTMFEDGRSGVRRNLTA